MPDESIKPQLLDLLQRARTDEAELIASLTDVQRSEEGTLHHWSVKDLVSHLNYWRGSVLARLQMVQRGETPFSTQNFLELNDQNFEQTRYTTWAEILDDSQRNFDGLVSIIETISDSDLTDPQRFEWRKGEPLWTWIRGNAYDHPEAHIAQYYSDNGDKGKAWQMQRELADLTVKLDPSPRSRGTAVYNYACFLSLNGEPDQAIQNLRESFVLRPDLIEFSKQDSDLNPLRELPEYQALFQPV